MGLLSGRCRQLAAAYAPLILARLQHLGILSVRLSPHEQYTSLGQRGPGLSPGPEIGLREKDDGLRVGGAGPFICAPLWPTPASSGIGRIESRVKGRPGRNIRSPAYTLTIARCL